MDTVYSEKRSLEPKITKEVMKYCPKRSMAKSSLPEEVEI
jgi:hypothetical protein